jgi:hypothetical protein
MLATLRISKAVDNEGKGIVPKVEMTTGLERYVPFIFSLQVLRGCSCG